MAEEKLSMKMEMFMMVSGTKDKFMVMDAIMTIKTIQIIKDFGKRDNIVDKKIVSISIHFNFYDKYDTKGFV